MSYHLAVEPDALHATYVISVLYGQRSKESQQISRNHVHGLTVYHFGPSPLSIFPSNRKPRSTEQTQCQDMPGGHLKAAAATRRSVPFFASECDTFEMCERYNCWKILRSQDLLLSFNAIDGVCLDQFSSIGWRVKRQGQRVSSKAELF